MDMAWKHGQRLELVGLHISSTALLFTTLDRMSDDPWTPFHPPDVQKAGQRGFSKATQSGTPA